MLKKNHVAEHSNSTASEDSLKQVLQSYTQTLVAETGPNWDSHISTTMTRQAMSRLLYWDFLYQRILDKSGIIIECGVQYGATMAVLTNLRGIYEPYNYSRKIIGFDTFEGFSGSERSMDGPLAQDGDYNVVPQWDESLNQILDCHVRNSPLAHVQQSVVISGDARETVPLFLAENPHLILSMVILDMDIYSPTKVVLEAIKSRLMKGSIIVFDEFNCDAFPGETQAFLETFEIGNHTAKRHPHQPFCAYVEI